MINLRISDLTEYANDVSMSLSNDFQRHNASNIYNYIVQKGIESGGRIVVIDLSGVVQADSFSRLNGYIINTKEAYEVVQEGMDTSYGFHKIYDSTDAGSFTWSINMVSAIIDDSKTVGAVIIVQSIADIVQRINQIQLRYYIIYAVSMLILIVIFGFLINRILYPLNELRKGTEAISGGDFSKRVKVSGRDEFASLGEAFNNMAVRLEDVDRARSDFISNASHELKTPLTSVKILTESILYENGVEESVYKDFLGEIDKEIDRMTELVNDLLFMTRLENLDPDALPIENTSVPSIVDEVIDSLKQIADQKGILLTKDLRYTGNIDCLRGHLKHAISNLVENGIKYTEQGSVTIRTSRENDNCVFEIIDTGEGIAKKEQEKIFERFYRVSKSRTRETGGSGLGLYIVQRVAVLHNGSVSVESEEGKGAVFSLRIPISASLKRPASDKGDK
ncbi:MAG: HAMP domain-containing histidine kinase [Clostridia bacterium]|nr:HAMP domain-containing histidine kinase [Clostridia bacterium]